MKRQPRGWSWSELPLPRRQLSDVTAFADIYEPLDHASRNLPVLARRSTAAVCVRARSRVASSTFSIG